MISINGDLCMHKNKTILSIIIFYSVLILSFWITTPVGDDTMFHLLRIGELAKEMNRGLGFPIYIFRDVYYYYGYPIPIFYCCLFLYPFSLLVCLGLKVIVAYKLMVSSVLLASFFSSYYCLFKWNNNKQLALTGAFIYGIQPYFLIDLFVRAAIGEAMVFIFFPFVLLGFFLIVRSKGDIIAILYLAVGMAGIICSHVISTVLTVIVLTILFVIEVFKRHMSIKKIGTILLSVIICSCLSIGYVAPLLEQMLGASFRAEGAGHFINSSINIISMILPMHLSIALSSLMHTAIIPSQIGGAIIVMICFSIFTWLTGYHHRFTKMIKFLLCLYYLSTISLMTNIVWAPIGKVLGFMQFTWRIFIVISMIGTATIILSLKEVQEKEFNKKCVIIATVSAAYVLIVFFSYFGFRNYLHIDSNSDIVYTTETSDDLYLPKTLNQTLSESPREICISDETAIDYSYYVDTDNGSITLNIENNSSANDQWIEFPFLMYKGYCAINSTTNEKYNIRMSANGFVEVMIPRNVVGSVIVSYTGTFIQQISFYISILSMLILITFSIYKKMNKGRHFMS